VKRLPKIVVLAGVNGSGKSIMGGEFAQAAEGTLFNPGTIAARIKDLHPNISMSPANARPIIAAAILLHGEP
jgi:predicted ABC-type ATPase